MKETLRTALASRIGVAIEPESHAHECKASCASPCSNAGRTFQYAPIQLGPNSLLLEVVYLNDGGRVPITIEFDDFWDRLGLPPVPALAVTHALLSSADPGGAKGYKKYFDAWRDAGIIS